MSNPSSTFNPALAMDEIDRLLGKFRCEDAMDRVNACNLIKQQIIALETHVSKTPFPLAIFVRKKLINLDQHVSALFGLESGASLEEHLMWAYGDLRLIRENLMPEPQA